jgi:hypothetical protein
MLGTSNVLHKCLFAASAIAVDLLPPVNRSGLSDKQQKPASAERRRKGHRNSGRESVKTD